MSEPARNLGRRGRWAPYAYLAPAAALFGAFIAYPILRALQLSFTSFEFLRPEQSRFVGLANYAEILGDARAIESFVNTLYFTLLYLPPAVILPLLVAVLIDRARRGRVFFRTANFIPVVVSVAVVSVIWMWIYAPNYGLLKGALRWLAGATGSQWLAENAGWNWLGESSTAMPAIAAMCVWHGMGFNMLLYLVGLARIPDELYEAARIDGAGAFSEFAHITLPMLRPTIFLVALLCLIGSLKVFGQMYIMTGGGPADTTQSYVLYLYKVAFRYGYARFGYASALGYALALVIFLVSLASFRLRRGGAGEVE
jgi:multiple sugar transport system permease protein